MKHIITAAAGVAAVLAIAACAGSQGGNAGSKSPGVTQSASPSRVPTAPADAWKGLVGNTTVTAWCVVQKQTDKNGNPLNAVLIYVDNTGQNNADVVTVQLYYYDSRGQHVHTMSGDFAGHDNDLHLGSGDLTGMTMPPGLGTIGGAHVLEQSHNPRWELPPQVQTCAVAGIR